MTIVPIGGDCVWTGAEMAGASRWIRDLSPTSLAEIDAALRDAQRRGLAWSAITAADFPLPQTQALFSDVRDELETGCGMVKLRGLPVERYSEDELRLIWFGLGANLGRPVFQNCRGELMRAIRDEASVGNTDLGQRYGKVETGG